MQQRLLFKAKIGTITDRNMVGHSGRWEGRAYANTTAKERIRHMRKRLLSFVLAVLMIASLLPAAVLAADIGGVGRE